MRSAILSVVPSLDEAICDQIMSKGPVDVSLFYKQVTGSIVSDEPSDPLNLGVAGELFPALRWQSRVAGRARPLASRSRAKHSMSAWRAWNRRR